MRKALSLLIIVLFIFTSCTSLSLSSSRPDWIDNIPTVALSTVFVGIGEGESEDEARINAILSAISQMGEEIDIDYRDTYFTELYSTSRIEKFSTVISDEYSEVIDGVWHYYILTVSNTAKFNEARSLDYSMMLEREERLSKKVSEALSYYRNNCDTEAINALLEAVLITLEGETSLSDYTTEKLIERIELYISQIKFEDVKGKSTSGLSAFKVYRNKGLLHPSVENAELKITYPSLDPNGDILYLDYRAKSDEKGIVRVNITNAYTLKSGTMSVTIALDEDVIEKIDKLAGSSLLEGVKSLIESISFSSQYSQKETYSPGEAIIALALYDYDGGRVELDEAEKIIEEMCSSLNLTPVTVVEAEGEDSDEALSFLEENYSDKDVIYMVRIGIVERVHTLDSWYTKTEGNIIRIDNSTGERLTYNTMQYSSFNRGESADDALALERQIRITCGYVLGEF